VLVHTIYEDEYHVAARFRPETVKDVTERVLVFLNEVFGESESQEQRFARIRAG
jgi:hypothetical protein